MRALIVDDQDTVRMTLPLVVRRALGGSVVVDAASTLEAALESARLATPDLVILDLGLPGCSGIEALRRFLSEFPDSRVVVFSADAENATAEAVLNAGGLGIIPKTFTPARIAESLLQFAM